MQLFKSTLVAVLALAALAAAAPTSLETRQPQCAGQSGLNEIMCTAACETNGNESASDCQAMCQAEVRVFPTYFARMDLHFPRSIAASFLVRP